MFCAVIWGCQLMIPDFEMKLVVDTNVNYWFTFEFHVFTSVKYWLTSRTCFIYLKVLRLIDPVVDIHVNY